MRIDLPVAVIFDMDGVLADTEPLHGRCFVRAFAQVGIHIQFEDYRQAVTIGGSPVRDLYLSLGGDLADWDHVKSVKDRALQAELADHIGPLPGVRTLIDLLRGSGVRVGLATSARRRSMQLVLDRLGMWSCFDVFATKDEVDVEKPNPAVFLLAASLLRVDPARCVVIEDSPRGVLAANRAGMKCLAVPTPSTADGDFSLADLVVDSLEAVSLDTLRALFADS